MHMCKFYNANKIYHLVHAKNIEKRLRCKIELYYFAQDFVTSISISLQMKKEKENA